MEEHLFEFGDRYAELIAMVVIILWRRLEKTKLVRQIEDKLREEYDLPKREKPYKKPAKKQ